MKIFRALGRILPFALIAAVLFALAFYPGERADGGISRRVVEVWNVDTFEGGKGSRTAFLAGAARRVERENKGLYFFVTSYTKEGALDALKRGRAPDMLSFGVGLSDFMEKSLPLEGQFGGGETDGGCLAVPWCRGKYFLFSLTEAFGEAGETVISRGGCNLSSVAACLAGVKGTELNSDEAYVSFLDGQFRYLLGTQRDVCRFSARGKQVFSRELGGYCDLFQCVSVLSKDRRGDCELLIGELLSPRTQELLAGIGMYPAAGAGGKTVSVFASEGALCELEEAARTGDANFPEKFLKNI